MGKNKVNLNAKSTFYILTCHKLYNEEASSTRI